MGFSTEGSAQGFWIQGSVEVRLPGWGLDPGLRGQGSLVARTIQNKTLLSG